MSYNGWSNYETWNCKLWLDNDQGTQEMILERAEEILKENEGDKDTSRRELADYIKDEIEVSIPDLGCNMFADLLNAALSEIDYWEIAENILSDIEYTQEEEE